MPLSPEQFAAEIAELDAKIAATKALRERLEAQLTESERTRSADETSDKVRREDPRPLPTLFNQSTGKWEEVDPAAARFMRIPLGEPRSGSSGPESSSGYSEPMGYSVPLGMTARDQRGLLAQYSAKDNSSISTDRPTQDYDWSGATVEEPQELDWEGATVSSPADTGYTSGLSTTFGYNDRQDNGIGAWGDRTNNPDIIGVSLPIAELRRHFGDENKAHNTLVEVRNPETGRVIQAPIVDKGPADWVIARQGPTIDLTEGARRELGAGGKSKMEWKLLSYKPQDPEWEGAAVSGPQDDEWEGAQVAQPDQSEEVAPLDNEAPAKREVGAIESAYRAGKSSMLGLSEFVSRHGISPLLHGARQAIEGLSISEEDKDMLPASGGGHYLPGPTGGHYLLPTKAEKSVLNDLLKTIDESFFKRFVQDVEKQRQDLAFDPDTEVRTLAGQKGKVADFAGEAAEAVGGIVPDIVAAVVTGGASVAPKGLVAGLQRGAGLFTLPAARNGMDAANRVKKEGGSPVDQAKAFLGTMLETQAMAAVPMNVESKLATLPGRIASRTAQGGALGVATGEAFRQGENLLGNDRDFELTRAAIDAIVPGILGGAFGRKASRPKEVAPKAPETAKGGEPIGIVSSPKAIEGAELTRSVGGRIVDFLGKPQKISQFLRTIIHDTAARQKSGFDVTKQTVGLEKALPARKLEAIGMFLDDGGDLTKLANHAKTVKDLKARRAYEDALRLTPEELAMAKQIKDRFKLLLDEANAEGLSVPERQNYITHILHNADPLQGIGNTRSLSSYFKFAKKRSYNTFFDAIQDGAKPKTFNAARILAVYETVLKDAIHNKKLVEDLKNVLMEDGREALVPLKKKIGTGYEDYRTLTEVPGLEYLAIHPDAYKNIKAVFKKSLIREWWNTPSDNPLHEAAKGLTRLLFDEIQQTAKGTMFSLSAFHQTTEGVHLAGHRVAPKPSIKHGELSFNDPRVAKAAKAGIMVSPDRLSQQYFLDGLGTNSKNLVTRLGRKLGKSGKVVSDMIDGYTQYLFESYIPRAKIDLFEAINKRNQHLYAKEIKAGKYTPYDIEVLSADQANAALGHLNYARMARSQTVQHLMQMALLAPDFLEARARFAGQAARSAFGKVGVEQLTALAVLGIGQYMLARMLNQATHGDPEWDAEHPFEVKVTLPNGHERWIGMRSVPEDAYKFFHDPGQFMRSRLAAWPTVATDMVSGRNWLGEKSSAGKALTDMVGNTVPLPLRGFTEKWFNSDRAATLSMGEHLMKSAGLTVKRYSPISRVYGLAEEWKKDNGIKADEGLYPPSKYAQLRYALEDGDWDLARAEAKRLKELGTDVAKGFYRSTNQNFTGSAVNDKRLYDSLDKDDKAVFRAALKRRSIIIARYNAHVGKIGDPLKDSESGMLLKMRNTKIKESLDE